MANSFTRKKIENYSYGLNDVIGKGYSSQVYKGRNDETSQNVAVKVIDLKMLKNQINKVLLQNEILILKQLKNQSHILSLHQVYTTKNNTYIITQLCESDLSKLVKKGLSQQQSIAYMKQIIIGYLNFANRQIIHRDLKPANILITQNNQLKIADFGFAIKTVDAVKSSKYNVGSPLYMAPQSLRRNQYTLKTDIWALGIILFEMLTGETPWKAKNQKQLLKKIEGENIEDILKNYNFSNLIKQFLRKTLKVDKLSRMTVDELINFSFSGVHNISILSEKKFNNESKILNQRINHISTLTPKSNKSIQNRLFVDRSNENRTNSKDISLNKFNSFKNESINQSLHLKNNINYKYTPTNNFQIKKRDSNKIDKQNPQKIQNNLKTQQKIQKKNISKILVSQIHFCRFLFKLIGKIIDSKKNGLLQNIPKQIDTIISDYTGIIKHKIQNIINFSNNNFLQVQGYQQYKQTNDYLKLIKIAKQYKQRYSNQLKSYWILSKKTFSNSSTLNLINKLMEILKYKQNDQKFIQNNSKQIIILDYLITSKQLIDILKNGQNYERFSKKSRIEEIVQGKTIDISYSLYLKIIERAQQICQIQQNSNKSIYHEKYQKNIPIIV